MIDNPFRSPTDRGQSASIEYVRGEPVKSDTSNPSGGLIRITEKLLNEKIMALLKARASCVDARFIALELVADQTCNWRIAHFDPGNGDRYQCKLALRAIHQSLGKEFEMAW